MTTLEAKVVSIEKRLEELEETMDILGEKKTVRSIERVSEICTRGDSSDMRPLTNSSRESSTVELCSRCNRQL
jgi:hypothetical protein